MTTDQGNADALGVKAMTEARVFDGKVYGDIPEKESLVRLRDGLKAFADAVGGVHCMVIAGSLDDVNTGKSQSTASIVAERYAAHFDSYPWKRDPGPLHVILDSYGGSLDSAYKTALYLRRAARHIRVYVPRHAKSASMIIAIGAEDIVMSPLAELGPLDTQLKDPRNPDLTFSVLDAYQSVDYVRDFGLGTLPKALGVLVREAPRSVEAKAPTGDLIAQATNFALGGVAPMLDQVKALDFGAWGRNLRIAENYAVSVLQRLDDERADEEIARRIARRLVFGYTHHPYPIDINEALGVGLHVTQMDQHLHVPAHALAEACDGSSFVGFASDVDRAIQEIDTFELSYVVTIQEREDKTVKTQANTGIVDGKATQPGPD